ncbi:tyrosinase family protein [Palleronia caenipelagi]|uniref:Tyrosinase family protein n=1 Tax=Palleronia caenipelagi TaxID=2489174 RepID=A0A547PT19_9RHOB|nr:tyrosinase family protein [Palleronia caenipelagi]TRD17293.1 tyrosinase family protein [Palleronia caenipelagi]
MIIRQNIKDSNVAKMFQTNFINNLVVKKPNARQQAFIDNFFDSPIDPTTSISTEVPSLSNVIGSGQQQVGSFLGEKYTKVTCIHYFVLLHKVAKRHHNSENFLPWHRAFLAEFEEDLGMPLPYWAWFDESGVNDVPIELTLSELQKTAADLGETNYFANLKRFNPDGKLGSLSKEIQRFFKGFLQDAIANNTGVIWFSDDSSKPAFSDSIEQGTGSISPGGMHNAIHGMVGRSSSPNTLGHLSRIAESPFDPIFWLHHAYIDKIWANLDQLFAFWDQFFPLESGTRMASLYKGYPNFNYPSINPLPSGDLPPTIKSSSNLRSIATLDYNYDHSWLDLWIKQAPGFKPLVDHIEP